MSERSPGQRRPVVVSWIDVESRNGLYVPIKRGFGDLTIINIGKMRSLGYIPPIGICKGFRSNYNRPSWRKPPIYNELTAKRNALKGTFVSRWRGCPDGDRGRWAHAMAVALQCCDLDHFSIEG